MEYKDMNEWKENSEFNTSLIHDSMITSSMKKAKRDHRIKVIQTFSILIFIPILTFTLLVNTNQQFVSAVSDMPIIGDFIDMFKYNPSIYKARNTDEFQKIDKTYVTDDYTLYLEAMVVDEDQIAIYHEVKTSLDINDYYPEMQIQEFGFSNSYYAGGWKFNELTAVVLDPRKTIDLNEFTLEFKIKSRTYPSEQIGETLVIKIENDLNKIVQAKVTELNQEMMIDDQKITIEKVEILPLRSIIYIEQDSNNSKDILDFDLYMKSANGEIVEDVRFGIPAFGTGDHINAYVLESPYTDGGKYDVFLEKVRWIDKDSKEIIYNKDTDTCENLPPYIEYLGLKDNQIRFRLTLENSESQFCFGQYIEASSTVNKDGSVSYEMFYILDELEFNKNNETILIDETGYIQDVNEYITTIELE